eukprot:COSAG02_NODE_39260_length_419_cov_0.809375_1_plen_103_part_10
MQADDPLFTIGSDRLIVTPHSICWTVRTQPSRSCRQGLAVRAPIYLLTRTWFFRSLAQDECFAGIGASCVKAVLHMARGEPPPHDCVVNKALLDDRSFTRRFA